MTRFVLVPLPDGYYDHLQTNGPTPQGDCAYLCDADTATISTNGRLQLRAEVLVVAVDDPPVEPVP